MRALSAKKGETSEVALLEPNKERHQSSRLLRVTSAPAPRGAVFHAGRVLDAPRAVAEVASIRRHLPHRDGVEGDALWARQLVTPGVGCDGGVRVRLTKRGAPVSDTPRERRSDSARRLRARRGGGGGGARGLLLDREEELELRRKLLLGVEAVREVDAADAAVGVDLDA